MQEINCEHKISILNRSEASLSGIECIYSFNEKEVIALSCVGKINIVGRELKVGGFDEKRGSLVVLGHIDGIRYTDSQNPKEMKGKIAKRIFR